MVNKPLTNDIAQRGTRRFATGWKALNFQGFVGQAALAVE
jgi:hypothetical protein